MIGEVIVQGTVATVRLHGDLDLVTVEELRRLLRQASAGTCDVVVDLSDVPFVDVLSLSAILATADALRDQGRHLAVVGASPPVRRVCALLNAGDVLTPDLPSPRLAAQ